MTDASSLLTAVWREMGGADVTALRAVRLEGPAATLPSRLHTTALLQAAAAAAAAAAVDLARTRGADVPDGAAVVDSRAVAVAATSERHLRVDGKEMPAFAPLSRFLPSADGWVRLHANYPHHRAALLTALAVERDEDVAGAVAALPALEVERRVVEAGGVAAAVREPDAWRSMRQAATLAAATGPVSLFRQRSAPVRGLPPLEGDVLLPAQGVRVLDLTRVIAGPVATRTLALLGADVLRIDPPGMPEQETQHLDGDIGKRSAVLDLHTEGERFAALARDADVIITGYRPRALRQFGINGSKIIGLHPGLVVASLSAWGAVGAWGGRRGFDSIVQAATGISRVEAGDAVEPGRLPAQALDHGTGYLLAAAILLGLSQRAKTGGSWRSRASLARTARWLLDAGPVDDTGVQAPDPGPWLRTRDSYAGELTYAGPPFAIAGGPADWAAPPQPWGSSEPVWLEAS